MLHASRRIDKKDARGEEHRLCGTKFVLQHFHQLYSSKSTAYSIVITAKSCHQTKKSPDLLDKKISRSTQLTRLKFAGMLLACKPFLLNQIEPDRNEKCKSFESAKHYPKNEIDSRK